MNTTPEISIVIVNYNVKDLLVHCINSIYKYIGEITVETIVVDNDSADGSIEAIKKEFPQVILIENKNNCGFPKANNQGFEIAKGKYILMLNPDTEFRDDSLLKLYNQIKESDDIELIAPMLLNTDGSRQPNVWRFPKLWYIFCETHYMITFLGRKNYSEKDFSKPFKAESFSGAAIMFKKEVLYKIGTLDETMFWIEDIDFCYRATKAGMKLLYFPSAKVMHHIGQSAKKNYNVSISNQIINKIKFFKKHHSYFECLLVTIFSFYHVLLKLLVFGLLSPFNKIYFRKAKAYLFTLPLVFNPLSR